MSVEADVAAFARAMAHVSDPFVDRNAQLASLGMSDAAWRDLELGWYREFEQRTRLGDRGLVDVFSRTFAEEREIMRAARATPQVIELPAVSVVEQSSIDVTGESLAVLEPALPFRGRHNAPAPAGYEAAACSQEAASIDSLNMTVALDE